MSAAADAECAIADAVDLAVTAALAAHAARDMLAAECPRKRARYAVFANDVEYFTRAAKRMHAILEEDSEDAGDDTH